MSSASTAAGNAHDARRSCRGPSDEVGARTRSVVVVDDHEVLRAGTRHILDASDSFTVIGEAADVNGALQTVRELQPDVVLVDVRLPDGNGIDAARRMLDLPRPPVVLVLSAYDEERYMQAAMAAGVAGYVLKTVPAQRLISTIEAACEHPQSSMEGPIGPVGPTQAHAVLTSRESEIVGLVARGLANKQIAHLLRISPRTVEGHLNHVFEKVGVRSRTGLLHFALVHGLLAPGGRATFGEGAIAEATHVAEPGSEVG